MEKRRELFSLIDKVAFITGGAGLIGKIICEAYASMGANLIICDLIDASELTEYGLFLQEKYGIQVLTNSLDITDSGAIKEFISSGITCFGKIDTLVHLAAIDAKFDADIDRIPPSSFEDFPFDLWTKSVDVNVNGTFVVIQEMVKAMLKGEGGNIITVASTYSLVSPNQNLYREEGREGQLFKPIDYVATKSMIPNMTRYLATFYGRKGIRVNCCVPHGIYNNHAEAFVDRFAHYSPMGRMCSPEEIAGPFIFLASDASSYMTGSILVVDGGWTAW